jgi:hypothetical protein
MLSQSRSLLISVPCISSTARASFGILSTTGSHFSTIRLPGSGPSSKMSFHFASSEYAKCFQDLPIPNVPKLRTSAIEYLDAFDKESWFNDPVSHVFCLWQAEAIPCLHIFRPSTFDSSLDCFPLARKRTSWRYHD